MTKLLLTGGCSFSECYSDHIDTWPRHLYRALQPHGYTEHRSSAVGSQGNGLISRGIIYNVIDALKTHRPQDILVGVMWSGADRHDYRCDDPDILHFVQDHVNNGWMENPTSFVKGADRHWVILNANWAKARNREAETHYRMFYDTVGASIYSIEHVLRTQWFLKSQGIRYFFTNYIDDNLGSPETQQHIEVEYLIDNIDQSNLLPVTSEYAWVRDNSKLLHLWPEEALTRPCHPVHEHHKEFTDQVIMPWLQSKEYLPVPVEH